VAQAAASQGGVLAHEQLDALGITWSQRRAELAAGRWQRLGEQCLQVGPSDQTSAWWSAIFEVGPTAVLDGVTALLAAGLKTIAGDAIHVAVAKSVDPRAYPGVRVHETRRYREEDVLRTGIPRMRTATAAVHAALWARTDREASLFVMASVQQGLVAVEDLVDAVALVKRDKRRRLLIGLLVDVTDGLQALGERDFADACRQRGFPKPDHQQMRQLPTGRVYYDTVWTAYGVKVEIHGAQHLDVVSAMRDALKENAASLEGAVLIRVPNHAFRTDPEPFLDQIGVALRASGWQPAQRPGLTA
jgi:very-short-patch-repair endonuclease